MDNKYVYLKRKIYLTILPLLFFTNLTYWLFSPYVDQFMEVVLPIFCIYIAVVWILVYLHRFIRICEFISLGIFTLYHCVRIYTFIGQIEDHVVNVYAFWSPVYFFYVFMVLERKYALSFSLFIHLVTIIMGIPYFHQPLAFDTLMQFYVSTILYTLILFYFQKLVAVYIESDILRKNAYYDSLTEIGNRRLIDNWLEDEVKRCHKTNGVFSIIYFDIDFFKKINDNYGHNVGDSVLIEFSSLVKAHIQPSDFFGRWGGEEFMIILRNRTLDEAKRFAENLREIIENHSFRYVGKVTASFGVTSLKRNDLPLTLLKRADKALYRAKNSGRNLVKAH